MKNPAAFISYARRDDAAYAGRITGLRQRLQRMVAAAIGRDFEIFQDCEGIAWGQHWRSRLDEALDEALFLIPILTPSYFNSEACRAELEAFLELERRSGRKDRILSLYFLDAPVYDEKADALAAILSERQHRDWRDLRIDPVGSAKVMRALDRLARELAAAIHARQAGVSPPPIIPDTVAQIARLKTTTTDPEEREATASVPTNGRTRNGALRKPGEVFRDIDEPWCPELVVIPAGSFVMGSPETEDGRSPAEGPQHEVRLAQPFALGRYLVNFEEYDHFCAESKRREPTGQGWGRGRRPVINVSWEDAQAYCAWLRRQTGQPYRLPSEAEWEYACRAGTTTPFWTGETISTEQANYDGNYTYRAGRKSEYRARTTPVDTFKANPWGLHDMHGNVWEWCEDCWNDSYHRAPTDGSAWLKGDCSRRVVRGGSWSAHPTGLRSAIRLRHEPVNQMGYLGFRISRRLIS
jgi:formylglycine-generating enzyme required for sulfatase activity